MCRFKLIHVPLSVTQNVQRKPPTQYIQVLCFKYLYHPQNAHAYVNAAFRIPVDGLTIKGRPSIVLGGISAHTVSKTIPFDFT